MFPFVSENSILQSVLHNTEKSAEVGSVFEGCGMVGGEGVSVTNLNVISMFTVAERKSQNSKLITWGGGLAGWLAGNEEDFYFTDTD